MRSHKLDGMYIHTVHRITRDDKIRIEKLCVDSCCPRLAFY
jgi:hypothetical protein